MKQFATKERELAGYRFYVRPLPALKAVNISVDLFAVVLPALASLAPLVGGESDMTKLLDVDPEVAATALAKGVAGLSGDKAEVFVNTLLTKYRNVSFEPLDTAGGKAQILTEELLNEIFCTDVQDLFILAFDVIKSNYNGFFLKLADLFGDPADALRTLLKKETVGLTNTAS